MMSIRNRGLIEMRDRNARTRRLTATDHAAEFRLRGREFSDRRALVAIGLSALGLGGLTPRAAKVGISAPAETQAWAQVVTVDGSHAAGPVLQVAFTRSWPRESAGTPLPRS